MKVIDHCPRPGRIWSIEVPSSIGRRPLARLVSALPEAQIVTWPGLFSFLRDEPFCRFTLGGRTFTIEAVWPAGDTFEISPDPRGCVEELLVVRQALLQHPPLTAGSEA